MALDQGQEMTLTFKTHIPSKLNQLSASTNFQVTGCNSFWKIHCFHFFLLKSLCYQIWPCRKIGKVTPGSSFEQTMMGRSPRCYISSFVEISPPVLEKKIFEGFLPYMAWRPFWSCDQDAVNKFRSPYPRRLHIKFGFNWPSGFGGEDVWRWTDDG